MSKDMINHGQQPLLLISGHNSRMTTRLGIPRKCSRFPNMGCCGLGSPFPRFEGLPPFSPEPRGQAGSPCRRCRCCSRRRTSCRSPGQPGSQQQCLFRSKQKICTWFWFPARNLSPVGAMATRYGRGRKYEGFSVEWCDLLLGEVGKRWGSLPFKTSAAAKVLLTLDGCRLSPSSLLWKSPERVSAPSSAPARGEPDQSPRRKNCTKAARAHIIKVAKNTHTC